MMRTIPILCLVLMFGCISTRITVTVDEDGQSVTVTENHNLIRVGATAQVVTYNMDTQDISISQVLAADAMSPTLMAAWSRLMDVAGYALTGAGIAAAAGGPTTPAAIGGALIGYAKNKLTNKDEPEPTRPKMSVEEALRIIREEEATDGR